MASCSRHEPLDEPLVWLADRGDEEIDVVPVALHRSASDAVGDVRVASNLASYRSLYGPDGRNEHEPLSVVELPAPTVDRLGAAAGELGRAKHIGTAVGEAVRTSRATGEAEQGASPRSAWSSCGVSARRARSALGIR
jgi:hypothetical protein